MSTDSPKNIIYFGVPGTGKTYQLQQLMSAYTDTLQQDDSYLQKHLNALSWRDIICMVLLAEKRMLSAKEIAAHTFITQKTKTAKTNNPNTLISTITNELHRFSDPNSTTITRENINHASNSYFDKDASGAWYILDEAHELLTEVKHILAQTLQAHTQQLTLKRYSFVSFHQSYGYEEFIEGLRPILDTTSKQLTYQIQQGAFLQLCEQAENDPTQRYAFFIDEINRANISKVFGELLTLIETDKRKGMPNQVSVKLAYSGSRFSVPANVDIYATMNIADRSLTPLDSAMRRRFEFIEMPPKPALLAMDVEGVNLQQLLTALNIRIAALIGQDFVIGHAPFLKVTSITELNAIMQTQIIPLLQEYCFNDWHNIQLILADDQKQRDTQFVQENNVVKQLNLSFTKPLFSVNNMIAQLNKASYVPIYEHLT